MRIVLRTYPIVRARDYALGAMGTVGAVKVLRVLRREKLLEQQDAKLTALQGEWS